MEKNRDGFRSRTGFVLACIGSAVGMGNIWRFPYMVSDWGGMTFLIPYVLFVVLIGASGVIEEMALGRAAKGGPIKAFGCCTEIRTGKKKPGEIVGVIPGTGVAGAGDWLYGCGRLDLQIRVFSHQRRTVSVPSGYGRHCRAVWKYCFCIRQ